MSLTVAQFQTVLIRRVGALYTAVGLNGTDVPGGNDDLQDPMAYAIRQSGGSVADPLNVGDADVLTVSSDRTDKLFDVAELRALETALSAYHKVDIRSDGVEKANSDLGDRLVRLVSAKRTSIAQTYGSGVQPLTTGSINYGFQSTRDER